jgi:hypothetical protein
VVGHAAAFYQSYMTEDQLKIGKQMLVIAFESRMLGAKTYRQALEYLVPLTGGDENLIRDARDSEAQVAAWVDQTLARLKDTSAADMAATFRK